MLDPGVVKRLRLMTDIIRANGALILEEYQARDVVALLDLWERRESALRDAANLLRYVEDATDPWAAIKQARALLEDKP